MKTHGKSSSLWGLLVPLVLLLVLTPEGASSEDNFELTILHLNDVHARFEETSETSGRCTEKAKEKRGCFGGFPRIHTAVSEIRRTEPNVLFLSGGDYYQGTVWYTVHKWRVTAHMLNLIQHDAMAFGNHEFDDNIAGIVPLLKNLSFPVLAANIDAVKEPQLQGLFHKSVVLERGGRKIGIVGYLTTETLIISKPGRLDITDEVSAVRAEAQRLKGEGVDIILALGHAGYNKDRLIARTVEEVDAVIGGHSNTFLYNGEEPSTDPSVSSYPHIEVQKSGRRVPVVQAYAFGKYLGFLKLIFDKSGEVTSWSGNPILLDSSIPQDPTILKELEPWKAGVLEQTSQEIGRTFVLLDGDRRSCRRQECNFGNLLTDAVIQFNVQFPDDERWSRVGLAVLNGGGIRASIDERNSNGSITLADIMGVAPFQNVVDIAVLKGQTIRKMFEHSIRDYDPEGSDLHGKFLQVSGFKVAYDIEKPNGHRVVHLQARCLACRVPTMYDVVDDQVYEVALPSYMIRGGDGYSMIKDEMIKYHSTAFLDTDIYVEHIQKYSPIYAGVEGRIIFINSTDPCFESIDNTNYETISTTPGPSKQVSTPPSDSTDDSSASRLASALTVVLAVVMGGLFGSRVRL
ncbi:snake venom 5'-nucleotidase-like [Oratosquilla oratoria]|uniref:snake venom 5'-nucleotidase-like n=1 Tax=Oratosquilla oratoria TaxID=337810 RepID=UPI003F7749D6